MKIPLQVLLCSLAFFQLEYSLAAEKIVRNGFVGHGRNGLALECPFYFEEELAHNWLPIDPPPVTIQTAAAIVRYWVESNFPGGDPLILSYNLRMVSPWEHDFPMWVYFINYGVFTSEMSGVSDDDLKNVAITMSGVVVEPECNTSRP